MRLHEVQGILVQVLDQQAQDLEETMQQLVQKGRDLHDQQQRAASLQKQPALAASESDMPESAALAAIMRAEVEASRQEYEQLQQQADNKARMVRYLSDQVQERSEDVREAQQLMSDNSRDASAKSVKETAARYPSAQARHLPFHCVSLLECLLDMPRSEEDMYESAMHDAACNFTWRWAMSNSHSGML